MGPKSSKFFPKSFQNRVVSPGWFFLGINATLRILGLASKLSGSERMDRLGSADVLLFEGFRFDLSGGDLFRLDEAGIATPVAIGTRALDLLRLLVERQGKLVSKDAIMEAVWPGTVVEEGNLTVQLSALRRILDQNREQGSCIQTVPGRGYRFVAPVTRVEFAASPTSGAPSGNGSDGPIAERQRPQGQGAPGQIGRAAPAPTPRGRYRLWGGITATVIATLVLVAAVAAGNWRSLWSGDAHPAPRLSIVVLPFANLSDDREQQYFADGITEDVTTDLSRLAHMFVISRNTAFTYRNKPIDAKQIGRELGVRYVLDGSVRRSGNQVRVSAQLIDADTDAQLWAERFDRDTGEMFALQNAITARIAVALDLEVTGAEAARRSEHPDAMEYILRGRAALSKPSTPENYVQAISLYERALTLDPGSVEAKSWLATALVTRMFDALADSPAADVARAEELAGQALAASPRSPLAHFAKGMVLRAQGRDEEAIPEYEAVIAFNPNWVYAITSLGWAKFMTGSIQETIPLQEQAIRLSPSDPAIDAWYWRIGMVHLLQSRTDEAILWLERARSANPGRPSTHTWLASAYALKGEADRAAGELTEARRLVHGNLYSSITRLKATLPFGVPKIRALYESTFFVGLRKAGMPDE
jgi:TolB-like protein/DNA-binding winged helix-turn-helix (wHTH) protein/Flp pilus assembly protein TadD